MVKVSPKAAASEKAATGVRSTVLFCSSKYSGFIEGGQWHSDAQQVTWLLAQYPMARIEPTLRIRSGNAIDRLQMFLQDPNGKDYPLTRFGGSGGAEMVVDSRHLRSILQVRIWATKSGRYHSRRLGCIKISYTAESGFPEQTFGKYDDELLGTVDTGGMVPIGFSGNSGDMVDGIALLLAQA